MVPTEGVETAEPVSLAFVCFCNRLQERKLRSQKQVRNCLRKRRLRSQKQNAKIASERTNAKENERILSSIVIKNIGFLCGASFSESLEPNCSARRWRAPPRVASRVLEIHCAFRSAARRRRFTVEFTVTVDDSLSAGACHRRGYRPI